MLTFIIKKLTEFPEILNEVLLAIELADELGRRKVPLPRPLQHHVVLWLLLHAVCFRYLCNNIYYYSYF